MRYEAELNGTARAVGDLEQLKRLLGEVRKADRAALYLRQIKGEMKGFERFLYKILGITTVVEGKNLILLTRGDRSVLVFGDEAGQELRVVQNEVEAGPAVDFELGDGSVSTHPVGECMDREEALRAIEDFYSTGKPPNWLQYRKIR